MYNDVSIKEYEKRNVILFNSYSKVDSVVMSNHYPCELVYDGMSYNSTEQLFYVGLLSNHPDCQDALLHCKDAKEVKKKGDWYLRRFHITDNPAVEIPLLRFCIRLKYLQCQEFREFLQKHPTQTLVEYAPWGDDTYGMVDVDENTKWSWNKGVVRGQNVCGRIIEGVRKEGLNGKVVAELPKGIHLLQPQLF